MGYIAHRTMVLTSWREEDIKAAHAKALELARQIDEKMSLHLPHPPRWARVVSPIIQGVVNDYYSFFIAPDGSKEGWDDSDAGDWLRTTLALWISAHDLYVDYVIVRFGGDDSDLTNVEYHNDSTYDPPPLPFSDTILALRDGC